jgi:hypothetical protein
MFELFRADYEEKMRMMWLEKNLCQIYNLFIILYYLTTRRVHDRLSNKLVINHLNLIIMLHIISSLIT